MSIRSGSPRLAGSTQTLVGNLMAVTILLTPLLSLYFARSIVPLVILVVVIGTIAVLRGAGIPKIRMTMVIAMLGIFLIWTFVSASWSIDPHHSIKSAFKLSGNLLLGVAMVYLSQIGTAKTIADARIGLIAGFTLTAGFLVIEGVTAGALSNWFFGFKGSKVGLFWLNQVTIVLTLLAWPLAGSLRKFGNFIAVIPLITVMLVAYLIRFDTAIVAVGISIVLAATVYYWRSLARPVIASLVVMVIFLAPVMSLKVINPVEIAKIEVIPNPAVHRFHIWQYSAEIIAKRPLIGHGMNTSRIFGASAPVAKDEIRGGYGTLLPLHPHNFALQVWLELGAVGAAFLVGIILATLFVILADSMFRIKSVVFAGQFCVACVFLGFSVGLLQSWYLATLWVVIATTLIVVRERQPTAAGNR